MSAQHVYAKRLARIASSIFAMSVAVAGGLSAFANNGHPERATYALAAALVIAVVTYLVAYAVGRLIVAARIREALNEAHIPRAPRAITTTFVARTLAESVAEASLTWSFAAIALLGPLSLHLLFALVTQAHKSSSHFADDFGGWIGISMLIVGHAHVVAVILAVSSAKRVAAFNALELRSGADCGFSRFFGYAVLASAIPGAILILIPPAITAMTALLLLAIFAILKSSHAGDLEALEKASLLAASNELDKLRRIAESENTSDLVRAQAVSCLIGHPRAEITPTFDRCLTSSSPVLLDRTLAACVEVRHVPPLDVLEATRVSLYTLSEVYLVELVSRHKDERVEPMLHSLLDGPSRAVKIAVIEALARVGTVKSVAPLKSYSELFLGGRVASEARSAILRIQDRLDVRAGRGQLALAPNEAAEGALSISTTGGALSISDP